MILRGAGGSSGTTGEVPVGGAISRIKNEGVIDDIGAGRFVLGDGCGCTTGLLGSVDGFWATSEDDDKGGDRTTQHGGAIHARKAIKAMADNPIIVIGCRVIIRVIVVVACPT